MSFEKFFKVKLENDVESGLEGFVREMMVDIIKSLKGVCKETWEAAQQEIKEAEKPANNEQSVKSICPNCKNRHCNKDRWMAGAIVTGCSGQK